MSPLATVSYLFLDNVQLIQIALQTTLSGSVDVKLGLAVEDSLHLLDRSTSSLHKNHQHFSVRHVNFH